MVKSAWENRRLIEKLEILLGERGNADMHSLRRKDIKAITQLVNTLEKNTKAAGKVDVPELTSTDAAANPPTQAEFNALRADVVALHQALSELVAAIS